MTSEPVGRGESAIVRPTAAAQHIDIRRVEPSERWQPFIQYHWIVRWECPEPFEQQVIPQPCVHVSAEPFEGRPRLLVNGITREPFVRTLTGTGHVLGAAFKPASFRAVLGADLGAVSGRIVPIGRRRRTLTTRPPPPRSCDPMPPTSRWSRRWRTTSTGST